MDRQGGKIRSALKIPRMRGQLRLKIVCSSAVPSGWAISVVHYSPSGKDGRVDCIDHENRFTDINGQICSGFHRHEWDREQDDCKRLKSALTDFKPLDAGDFIKQAFALMNICPKEEKTDDQMPIP